MFLPCLRLQGFIRVFWIGAGFPRLPENLRFPSKLAPRQPRLPAVKPCNQMSLFFRTQLRLFLFLTGRDLIATAFLFCTASARLPPRHHIPFSAMPSNQLMRLAPIAAVALLLLAEVASAATTVRYAFYDDDQCTQGASNRTSISGACNARSGLLYTGTLAQLLHDDPIRLLHCTHSPLHA